MRLRSIGSSVGDAIYKQIGRANARLQKQRSLPVDVLENDKCYLVVFDTPGAQSDDIQVRYLEGEVRIQVDRFRQFHEGYEMRFPGRSMTIGGEAELPRDAVVAPDAGTARLSATGTLTIEIPKRSALESAADHDEDTVAAGSESQAEEISIDD